MLFERLLAEGKSQYLVLAGQPERIARMVEAPAPLPEPSSTPVLARSVAAEGNSLEQCVLSDLKQQVHQLLKTNLRDLLAQRNFVDFGFDSISLAEFSRVLSRFYVLEISPSVFFSYSTLQRLATYLLSEHRPAMETFYRAKEEDQRGVPRPVPQPVVAPAAMPAARPQAGLHEPIAIIGMSGRFPKSRNVDELWQLLEQGTDAVEEIPPDRFDWRHYAERTNSRWGGFIPGIAEFDPLFFEISPLEAERMDPRQRHLLQEAWLALEDAGYGPEQIARNKIGMFVGVEEGSDYQKRLKQVSLTSTHNGVLASRLAYFLNLKGPVMAINTACSSSLVAAHTACQSLRQNECDTAIAAGVNLMVAPEAYVGMTEAGMLSPDGKCYVFDRRANGMVPGEAVAVMVLKRLSQALADGDPVHAVIRGSGINYDGKTNGITAPSGASQTELMRLVYDQCRLQPKEIDYVVTHGTGTQLGDPVEINALYDAFKGSGAVPDTCALTSIKSNIGHTFAASGLVSLISLVEAMRHRTIPASLHCEQENDYIRWRESPFYVNKRAKPWVKERGRPRIGAVSAFGISGTNAHMVVQEHLAEPLPPAAAASCYLFALSAKTESALQDQIRLSIAYLQTPRAQEQGIDSISYTLLHGRHHFEHRAAIVACDLGEAVDLWSRALGGSVAAEYRRGVVDVEFSGEAAARDEIESLVRQPPTGAKLLALAEFYCQGYDIPWTHSGTPRRASLPGYPFARERYWIDEETKPAAKNPASLYPEMARVAAEQRLGKPVTALGNMVWGLPPNEQQRLAVRLHGSGADTVYSIAPEGETSTCNHLGEIFADAGMITPARVDIRCLRAGMRPMVLKAVLPGISNLYGNATQMLSTVRVSENADDGTKGMLFEPRLIDAACRLIRSFVQSDEELLPLSLRRIESLRPLPREVTLHFARRGQKFDLSFLDAEGRTCLYLRDFAVAAEGRLSELSVQP